LLRGRMPGRRTRRRGFEHRVELLVRPILLRMPRVDPLRHDAQADPPHRQARQAAEPGAAKRRAVITADALRQPILGERARKTWTRDRFGMTGQRVAAQHEATEAIPQGEGITVDAIPGAKFPFEIRRPDRVGRDAGIRAVSRREKQFPLAVPG